MKIKTILLLTLLTSLSCSNGPEEKLTLDEGKILNELHQQNIGKIAFMNDYISFDKFSQKDFADRLPFTDNGNLGMQMFLEKTLTYYLHQLEPELSVNELCKKGNFHLTFFVDNKQLYEYPLQTGAGSCSYKNSQTVYGVPFVTRREANHWGEFLWMKFLKKEGGQQALAEGNHQLKIEVRPYIKHQELKVGEIIAQGEVMLMRKEIEVAEADMAIQPVQAAEGWTIAPMDYNHEKIRALNKKIAQGYFKQLTSIAILKNGALLLEEYFNGANRASLHDTRSVGKSLASTILGIAIKEGHIKDENAPLKDFYALKDYKNYSPIKETVTLKNLLTMSSGFDGSDSNPNSPGNEENMYPTDDWVKFSLDLPMDANKKAGENWDYFTAGAVILGDIINKKVPGGLEKYTDAKLLQPLDIKNYKWQYTPQDVPNTAGSFQMNTLGLASYGQLYLDKGKANGKTVLSESWVNASLSPQASIPERENEAYGYLFWQKKYTVGDQSHEVFYASGNGGNKVMMFKDLGLVIVITATAYGQPYMHFQADEIVRDYLLPAVL